MFFLHAVEQHATNCCVSKMWPPPCQALLQGIKMGLWLQQNKCHKNGRYCHELSHKENVAGPNNNEDTDCFH
jgi:hypothetical protein